MEEENVRGLDNSEEEGEIRWCNNREGKTSCCIVVEDIGVCVCVCVLSAFQPKILAQL